MQYDPAEFISLHAMANIPTFSYMILPTASLEKLRKKKEKLTTLLRGFKICVSKQGAWHLENINKLTALHGRSAWSQQVEKSWWLCTKAWH